MTGVGLANRRLQLALIALLGILLVAAIVALATGRTGASMALSVPAVGLFWVAVATRLVPIRHRSGQGR